MPSPTSKGITIHTLLSTTVATAAVISSFYVINKRRKERRTNKCFDGTSTLSSGDNIHSIIGTRGRRCLAPVLPYLHSFFKCIEDPCHPIDNPEGYIALCVAENKLILDYLSSHLNNQETARIAFSDKSLYCYNSFLGLQHVREAVAYFLARKFLCCDTSNLTKKQILDIVRPNHVALGSGCAGLLNYLFYSLAEENDAVLIPAPYYCAFESDMKAIAKCVPFAVQIKDPSLGPTPEELENAYKQARKRGLRVKILLLTNPNNPLGVIYSAKVIKDCIDWANGKHVHSIVDEIYALSVHNESENKFQSVIKVLDNNLGNYVHMVWALSKDFGSSGLRIGVLYSQNNVLIEALENLNIFSGVSHPMQAVTAHILTNDKFVDSLLEESRSLLMKSYALVTNHLCKMNIPFTPAEAGIFIYCDFSSVLPSLSFDDEAKFASLVEDVAKVVMTPGECQKDSRPGMFRICYAWVSLDVLEIGMKRIQCLIEKIKQKNWEDMNIDDLRQKVMQQ